MQQIGCDVTLFSQECPRGSGRLFLLHFIGSLPRHFATSPFLPSVHAHSHYKRTPSVLSGETQAFTYKSFAVSQLLRFSFCSPFVYFTPPLMQGLISQSRFELRHASPEEWRAGLWRWGKFPLHTSLEVDCAPLYGTCFNLQTEQREDEKGTGPSTHSWESLMSLQRCRPLLNVPLRNPCSSGYLFGFSSSY